MSRGLGDVYKRQALWNTYGITEETAYQILAMEGQEYTKTLSELGAKAAETETPTDAQGQ